MLKMADFFAPEFSWQSSGFPRDPLIVHRSPTGGSLAQNGGLPRASISSKRDSSKDPDNICTVSAGSLDTTHFASCRKGSVQTFPSRPSRPTGTRHHDAEVALVLGKSGKLLCDGRNNFLLSSFRFSECRRLGRVAEDHVNLRHRLHQDRLEQRNPHALAGTYNPTAARGHLRHTR